jgi:IS30 family transposase
MHKQGCTQKKITEALKTQFFFTYSYSSWEKGLIENTNKLVRQYILKKSISTILITRKSRRYNIKSTIDPEKN